VPDKIAKDEIIEYHAPEPISLPRPSTNSPLICMKPIISSNLIKEMAAINLNSTNGYDMGNIGDIPIGTMCKNNGCKQVLLIIALLII